MRHHLARPGSITTPRSSALAVAVVTLAAMGWPAGPVAAQDGSPSPAVATASPLAAMPEGLSPRAARRVQRVLESVPAIRELPNADGVTLAVADAGTFRSDLEATFTTAYPEGYLAAEDAAFTRLGLLGPDDDLAALSLGILADQGLASYDSTSDTLTLIGPLGKVRPIDSVVLAHEYEHAIQDAAYDLEAGRVTALDRSDAAFAQQALIEGDATAVMFDWAARELTTRDLLAASSSALTKQDARALKNLPAILRRQLEFPYIEGFAFVNALRGRGDWAAVDDAWASPPISTEQVLHPELYPEELPVEIVLPDVAAALGSEWSTAYSQTLGEMQLGVWVADGSKGTTLFSLLPKQPARADAAAGWGGDRLVSLDGPGGSWAIVWQTDWDTAQDAAEFRRAARQVVKDLPGATSVSTGDAAGGLSSPVLVLVADSDPTLRSVEGALGLTP
jgi:hypothetical protein